MCCRQVAVLPQPSVAVHVRSIPACPVQLGAAEASLNVMATVAAQLSVAVADPVCAGSVDAPQLTCRSAGQVMTGGMWSPTSTVALPLLRTGLTSAVHPWPGSKLPTAVAVFTWSPTHWVVARTRKLAVRDSPTGILRSLKVITPPAVEPTVKSPDRSSS